MSVERKCKSCKTWNKDNDNCINCGALISPGLIEIIRVRKRERKRENIPPSSLDIFLEKWKNSKFFLFRVIYYILYSIISVFFAIVAFITYIVGVISA